VEDRRLDHLRHVGGIGRRARVRGIGGEADLVVDDEMDRAAGAVTAQARQTETFRHNALAGKGRIAMQQQRQDLSTSGDHRPRHGQLVLLGARLAQHHRVHDFQVRRVGGQRQVDLVAVELAIRRGAEVVFHIAGAFHLVRRVEPPLNSWKIARVAACPSLGQHVEAAAVGHAEDDVLHAQLRRRA
jgi:hypothetical protein